MGTRFKHFFDALAYKWHHEKHDLPKPYCDIVVETKEGLFIDGYMTKDCRFYAYDKKKVEGLTAVVRKRWKYGRI